MPDYDLKKITVETWVATCQACGKPFRSDIEQKAKDKVESHIRDKHET